ncbi:hypothetical protein A4X13_0g7194 [Tilletia indica]|uniref:Uncharacterized protein n=1 Tax=Tilletia indica TaxID=43049 RepID=A0A177T6J5_9BASI|nr:hypothetical protein A4X13_0g7194 [Tilletia indica]
MGDFNVRLGPMLGASGSAAPLGRYHALALWMSFATPLTPRSISLTHQRSESTAITQLFISVSPSNKPPPTQQLRPTMDCLPSTTTQVARPKPRPYDRANHPDSSDEDDLTASASSAKKAANELGSSSPSDATDPIKQLNNGSGRRSIIASRAGQPSLSSSLRKISQPKGVPSKGSPATLIITSVFSRAVASPSFVMGSPPPPSQRLREASHPSSIHSNDDGITQREVGTSAEGRIDFTDADESQSSVSSTSTHKRKDSSPAAALESATIAWKQAQKTAADQKAAAEEGIEW